MVTVYSTPSCVQCKMTKQWLTNKGLDFDEVNIENNPDKVEYLRNLGFAALPVIEDGDTRFSGFNIPELTKLLK